jgi:DNA polymerase III delta prime subunit
MSDLYTNIHPNTKQILSKISESKKLPSVLIFHGAKSNIKLDFALDLINRLVNLDNNSVVKDKIFRKVHPDIQVFSAEDQDQYPLSLVKTWIDESTLSPFELKEKWIVIEDAEKLTPIHCNTLLKTLEEPTYFLHFILIVDSLQKLLDTVVSRATKVPFFSLSKQMIEKVIIDDEILSQNVRMNEAMAQGSIEQLQLLKKLHELNFFNLLHDLFSVYYKKEVEKSGAILDELEKVLQEESFSTKLLQIYPVVFTFFMELVKKIGEKNKKIYRKIPRFFELDQKLFVALKRHTKLKYCIEQLAIQLNYH